MTQTAAPHTARRGTSPVASYVFEVFEGEERVINTTFTPERRGRMSTYRMSWLRPQPGPAYRVVVTTIREDGTSSAKTYGA